MDVEVTPETARRHLAAVHLISERLSSTLDLDRRLRDILAVSMDAVGAQAGSILLHRPGDDTLVFEYVVGPKAAELTGFPLPVSDGIAGQAFRTGCAAVTNAPSESPAHRADIGEGIGLPAASLVTVPLKYHDAAPVGVMQVVNKRDGEFTSEDLEVLEIVASIAAAAIQNARLHRDAKLAAVADKVGDVSHDIKNKVTPIAASVDTLQPMLDEAFQNLDRVSAGVPAPVAESVKEAMSLARDFYPEIFQIIRDQVQEIQEYTRRIADAVKGVSSLPKKEVQKLQPVITKQVEGLQMTAGKHGVALVEELDPHLALPFDRFLVERAVYNLVNNAIPETPHGGAVTVRTRQEGEEAVIEVEDTGRGMPAHVLERILRGDAQSTKPGGTGLGTRIVYNAVAAHNGRLEGESREGEGTTLRMRLPMA